MWTPTLTASALGKRGQEDHLGFETNLESYSEQG